MWMIHPATGDGGTLQLANHVKIFKSQAPAYRKERYLNAYIVMDQRSGFECWIGKSSKGRARQVPDFAEGGSVRYPTSRSVCAIGLRWEGQNFGKLDDYSSFPAAKALEVRFFSLPRTTSTVLTFFRSSLF